MNRNLFWLVVPAMLAGCGGVTSSGNGTGAGDEVQFAGGEVTIGLTEGSDNPEKVATMAPFSIDKYEVTNAQYKSCVSSGNCTAPAQVGFELTPDYYTNTDYDDYPVAFVTWTQAAAYCKAQGKRLPTEAEWETAARGTDGRMYPWGSETPDCSKAHYGDCSAENNASHGPLPVGSLVGGVSPSGAYDMAGNMAEWVSDWYHNDAYDAWPDGSTPVAPAGGRMKSIRGGSWWCHDDRLVAGRREPMNPYYRAGNIGFRCARSAG